MELKRDYWATITYAAGSQEDQQAVNPQIAGAGKALSKKEKPLTVRDKNGKLALMADRIKKLLRGVDEREYVSVSVPIGLVQEVLAEYSKLKYTVASAKYGAFELRREIADYQGEIMGLESEIADLKDENARMKSELTELRSENSELREKLNTSDIKCAELADELAFARRYSSSAH